MLDTLLINACKIIGFVGGAFAIVIIAAILHEYVFTENKHGNNRDRRKKKRLPPS